MKIQISTANSNRIIRLLPLLAAGFVWCAAPTTAGASPVANTMSIEAYIAALLEGIDDDATKDLRPAPQKPTTVRTSKEPGAR